MLDLARRSGENPDSLRSGCLRERRIQFRVRLNPTLKHVPARGRGELKYVYAVVKFNNGGYAFEVMSKADVEAVRKRSQSQQTYPNGKPVPSEKPIGIWLSDYPEMAKKTVLRRVLKYCPLSVDVLSKIQSDGGTIRPQDFSSGAGDINLDGISFADYEPTPEGSEPPAESTEQTETQTENGLFPEGSKK
jgi:recombination protein RecT